MTEDLRRLAHARALMLGSSAFPPADHLAFLRRRPADAPTGAGLGRIPVGDLLLRDVDPVAERTEVIRVISETVIAHAPQPAKLSGVPAGILAAAPTWFGLERDGRLVGLHGGFFWDETLWVRRFYAILPDPYPWETHFEIEGHLHGHLWAQGMREVMIQLPAGTPNLAARRAQGWRDSHEMYFAHNDRPFIWLRRAFRPRRTVAAFPATWGPVTVREGTWQDLTAIRASALPTWWQAAPEHQARVAKSLPQLWGLEAASALLGTVDGQLRYGYLIREAHDDPDAAVISALHPPGADPRSAAFYYAALSWMRAAGFTTYHAYLRPDCTGLHALVHDCLAQGGTLAWVPTVQKIATRYPLARVLARPLEAYVAYAQGLLTAPRDEATLPAEFPAEARAWLKWRREEESG